MTHPTSNIYLCEECGSTKHGKKVGWMTENKDVEIVVAGPLNMEGEASLEVKTVNREEHDPMEVFDDEFLAAHHSYYVEYIEKGRD